MTAICNILDMFFFATNYVLTVYIVKQSETKRKFRFSSYIR